MQPRHLTFLQITLSYISLGGKKNAFLFDSRRRCRWRSSAVTWWLRWTARRSEAASIHGAWQKVCLLRSSFPKEGGKHPLCRQAPPSGFQMNYRRIQGSESCRGTFLFFSPNQSSRIRLNTRSVGVLWRMYLRMSSCTRCIICIMVKEAWYSWERMMRCMSDPLVFAECINYQAFIGLVKM